MRGPEAGRRATGEAVGEDAQVRVPAARHADHAVAAAEAAVGQHEVHFVAARREFDPNRIGVMALSLGGYYAPRAASLEPRFACCVAWGAQWDYHEIWARRLDELDSGKVLSLSVPPEHLQWVLGVSDRAAALKKLEGFRLDGIVQKMACPFLLLHGAGDEQIPLELAEKLFEAAGSKQKALKVFSRDEGGFHHCQVDNITIGVHYMYVY